MKHLVTALPTKAWMFIFILTLAPIIAGITEVIFLIDWSDKHPLLGDLVPNYQPAQRVIVRSLSSGILLGFSGWLILIIPTLRRFQQLPKLIKLAIAGMMVMLLLSLLWLELKFIFLTTFFEAHFGSVIGWPDTPGWIVTIGWIWTFGIILFMLSYYKRRLAPLQEN